MNKFLSIFFFVALVSVEVNAQDEIKPEVFQKCPRIHLENSIKAMGGRDTLGRVKSIFIDGYGHRYRLDESERAEGPFLIEYQKFEEYRDIANRKIRKSIKTIPVKSTRNITVADVVFQEENKKLQLLPDGLQEETYLNPEVVLFTALKAKDLNCGKHVTLQGIVNNVVYFTWNGFPVTIYLNSFTNLLTAVEITRPYPYDHYSIWGDIKTLYSYSDWTYLSVGMWYPTQVNIEQNGMPYRTLSFMEVKINQGVSEKDFVVPQEISQSKKLLAAKKLPSKAIEIQPGIYKLKDTISTYFVRQNDGLLILDAPFSSDYSAETLRQIKQLFPDAWLKGVVSTSDSWQAIGGLREFAANNIPIFSLDLNKGIIEKLLKAKYTTNPDKYAENIYKFRLNPIYQDFKQGEGLNETIIFPMRSESGERNLIVYFPKLQLLYASDIIRKDAEGKMAGIQKVRELNNILIKKNFPVKDVFSMHVGKMPWKEVLKSVQEDIKL